MNDYNWLTIKIKAREFIMKAPASPFLRFSAGAILLAVAFYIVVRAVAPNGLI